MTYTKSPTLGWFGLSKTSAKAKHADDMMSPDPSERARVVQRITDMGYYYRAGDVELGPFTLEDEQGPNFDAELATQLGAETKDITFARLAEIQRPTTFDEVADVLGSTVREDKASKLILLSGGVLAFTDQDQVNVLMSGESAGGKSYITLEVASYFPSDVVRIIATASPTAFFHDTGTWDREERVLHVDLRGQILVFLDQPHYMLMERLRPLLSHDRRQLLYKVTDRSKRGSLRTKNVVLEGFCTVIFCAASLSLDDQERTRVFILSPETSARKLEESLRLTIARVGDREAFRHWVETHPRRRWLKARIAAIRAANINEVIIPDQEYIYNSFVESRRRLAPRHQRDLPRILSLAKAHALLNWRHRESPRPGTIVANRQDLEEAFNLYALVAKPNELGLSPQCYEIYESVIKPSLPLDRGFLRKEEISKAYFALYGRHLGWRQLEKQILPALEASGLVNLQPDPDDRRRTVVCITDESYISQPQNNIDTISYARAHLQPEPTPQPTPLGERLQVVGRVVAELERQQCYAPHALLEFELGKAGVPRDQVSDLLKRAERDGVIVQGPFPSTWIAAKG